jgi:hypothetical protein
MATGDPFSDPRSREADELAAQGHLAAQRGATGEARELWLRAAELNREVGLSTGPELPRTRGAFALNAVWLCVKGQDLGRAAQIANEFRCAAVPLASGAWSEIVELLSDCGCELGPWRLG